MPTAIADAEGCIIWKNKLPAPGLNEGGRLALLIDEKPLNTGIYSVMRNDELISYNIIKTESAEECYYIVELVRSERMSDIMNTPAIRSYMTYLSSKIRNMAGVVTNTTDELYDSVSCGIFDRQTITERLNSIDKSMMSITKEVIQPDQFYALLDMDKRRSTLSMENELRRIVSEAEAVLGRKVRIELKCKDDIFFRMDRDTFETVIGGMTAMCCGCRSNPEKLIFSAKKINGSRAEISVASIRNKSDKSNGTSTENNMFFHYTCDLLCKTMGAVFTRTEKANGCTVKVEFDIISKGDARVELSSVEYSVDKGHFETVSLMLADADTEERYVLYDIDDEDKEAREKNIVMSGSSI